MAMTLSKPWESVKDRGAWWAKSDTTGDYAFTFRTFLMAALGAPEAELSGT